MENKKQKSRFVLDENLLHQTIDVMEIPTADEKVIVIKNINMTIFERVKKLHFPMGEYVVIGAGILEALGIRDTQDVDIIVKSELFKKLKESKKYKEDIRWNKVFLIGDDIEIGTKLDWENYFTTIEEAINTAMVIDGVPFLNLQETIKFKKAIGREKDFNDIKLIEEYLKKK